MLREKILVVDDEKEIAELVRDYLEDEQFEVAIALDGNDALEKYENFQPDLVILDIMLPKIDGLEVCRRIRGNSPIPIIMLSAKKSEVDKILGLGLGADDYVTKPFSPGEIVARVKAQLRRYNLLSPGEKKPERIIFRQLEIDIKAHSVKIEGKNILMSAKEFEVLSFFTMNPDQVFTREELFNQIWGYDEFGDINTVTVHIRKIREKMEKDPSNPEYIQTVWGVGYRFDGGKA